VSNDAQRQWESAALMWLELACECIERSDACGARAEQAAGARVAALADRVNRAQWERQKHHALEFAILDRLEMERAKDLTGTSAPCSSGGRGTSSDSAI
jgi:hypothetical protein